MKRDQMSLSYDTLLSLTQTIWNTGFIDTGLWQKIKYSLETSADFFPPTNSWRINLRMRQDIFQQHLSK